MLAFRNRRRHRRRRFTRRGPVGDPSTGRRICLPDASFQSRDPLLMSAACSSTTRPFFPFFHLLLLPSLFFLFFFFFFFVFNLKLGKKKEYRRKKGFLYLFRVKIQYEFRQKRRKSIPSYLNVVSFQFLFQQEIKNLVQQKKTRLHLSSKFRFQLTLLLFNSISIKFKLPETVFFFL